MLQRYLIVFTIFLSIGWTQNPITSQFSNAFADVAEKVNPAVVTILAVKEVKAEQFRRNNPFERKLSRTVQGKGLAKIESPAGTLIAYSTDEGTTADDNSKMEEVD